MKKRFVKWGRRGLALAALHASGCSSNVPCPTTLKPWNGTYDAGPGFLGFFPDGGLSPGACGALCGTSVNVFPCEADAGFLVCGEQCLGGRAPPSGAVLSVVDGSAASWIARTAELEGAAVGAFEHLALELAVHGLDAFVPPALEAALDEVRHARDLTRLALELGVSPTSRPVGPSAVRSLGEVALDNAAEGCGRELMGAMINRHQATAATDPRIRAAFAAVADDEERHAQFSNALAAHLMPQLSVAQRRRAREGQERMVAVMAKVEMPEAAGRTLGLMDETELRRAAAVAMSKFRI